MKRAAILSIVFLFVVLISANYAQMPQTIVVGVVYNVFHEEYTTDQEFFKQVDHDVALMQSSNINHVMIFPMSQWDPKTKELSWKRTDYLIKKIEEAHMKFVPLMLKEEQASYYFPIWKFKEIKGMWREHNLDNGNKNNRDDIDFADKRVYPLVEKYFKSVVERYGKNPALSFYNIWNEPHYNSNAPHVVGRFKLWLQKKYGTLVALGRAWGEEYSDWNQVSPFLTENWKSSMPQIDWRMFRNELNGDLLGELIQTLKQYDTKHLVNANPVGTPWANFNDFGFYNIDNWVIADRNDIHGISYYPDAWERGHNLEPCPFWLHNLAFNTIRCAAGNKNYILTELFTNTQNGLALNGYLTKGFVNDLAWTALANDCKGMIYWKWEPFMRGRQSLGRGLVQVNGGLAPRGEAVKEFGNVINQYGEVLYRAHLKKAQAAILVDIVGLLKTLEQSTEPSTKNFMYESNAGLFKALYEANISLDILRMDRGLNLETLKSYKIIYLPFQIVMRKNIAEILKEYVRQGGCVVADARTAVQDELDFAYRNSPGAGMDELFGAERADWIGGKTFFDVKLNSGTSNAPIQFAGKYFREQLKLKNNVEVLGKFADNNEPAIIKNHYGNGTAILSAVPLGASYYDMTDNPVNKVLLKFAIESGVVPDAQFISDDQSFVNLKVHTLNDTLIVYAINSDHVAKSGKLEVNVGSQKIKNVTEILTGENLPFAENDNKVSVDLKLKPEQPAVILINRIF